MKDCKLGALVVGVALLVSPCVRAQATTVPTQVETATMPTAIPPTSSRIFYNGGDVANVGPVGPVAPVADAGPDAPGVFFRYDAAFLRYHQSGGVQDTRGPSVAGRGANAAFDYEYTPRYTLGYEFGQGLGIRSSYWDFDRFAVTNDGTSFVDIEARTIDLELYRRLHICSGLCLEVFGGFRYGEFEQADGQGLNYQFNGYGGTVGLEVSQGLCGWGSVYARARWSMIFGDGSLVNPGALDDTAGVLQNSDIGMTELGIGWNSCCRWGRCVLTYGVGAEWHQWSDAAIAADSASEANMVDSSWAGFVFRAGLKF